MRGSAIVWTPHADRDMVTDADGPGWACACPTVVACSWVEGATEPADNYGIV